MSAPSFVGVLVLFLFAIPSLAGPVDESYFSEEERVLPERLSDFKRLQQIEEKAMDPTTFLLQRQSAALKHEEARKAFVVELLKRRQAGIGYDRGEPQDIAEKQKYEDQKEVHRKAYVEAKNKYRKAFQNYRSEISDLDEVGITEKELSESERYR